MLRMGLDLEVSDLLEVRRLQLGTVLGIFLDLGGLLLLTHGTSRDLLINIQI